MNFTIKELNELIYSLGITALNGRMLDKELNQSLMEKLHAELGYQLALEAEDEEADDDGNYLTIPSEDEFPNSVKNEFYDYNSHYVSNEEADEDYRSTLVQDEQRYEKSKAKPFDKSTSQCILDYVENTGASTYTELNEFYKFVTGGSNSFSHILKSLTIPYKNRKTQRYLVKEGFKGSNGKYVIKIANPSNWVEKSY
jgi:DNA polymerase II small subunit/DNA polymerase delta subunit B